MFTIRACRSGCRSASGSVSGWWLGIAGLTTPWREVADGTKCAGWTAGLSRGDHQWRVGFGCIDVYCRCRLSSWTVGRCMVKRWCWYCLHRGKRFRIQGGQGHVHCDHPKELRRGDLTSPWDTLRRAFDTCPEWEYEGDTVYAKMTGPKPSPETDRVGGVSGRIFTPGGNNI